MPFFHAKTPLDKAFEVSLLVKGLDGLFETVGGTLFLFIRPDQVSRWADRMFGASPHNFFARSLSHWAHDFTKGAAIFAALYLLSHGVVKLVLVIAILRQHLWAYPGLILVTVGFVVYQLYHIIFKGPTASFILLTLFDFVVVYLTTREYGEQKKRFMNRREATEAVDD